MAAGSQTSLPVRLWPRSLQSLQPAVLRFWSPGIRGGDWAKPCGQSKLGAPRPDWGTGVCLWLSGGLLNQARATCLSSCSELTSQLLTDLLWGGKSIPRNTEKAFREEATLIRIRDGQGHLLAITESLVPFPKTSGLFPEFPQWLPP